MGIVNIALSVNHYVDMRPLQIKGKGMFEIQVQGADMDMVKFLKQDYPTMEFKQRQALGSSRPVKELGSLTVTVDDIRQPSDMMDAGLGLATEVLNTFYDQGFKLISAYAYNVESRDNMPKHMWAIQN